VVFYSYKIEFLGPGKEENGDRDVAARQVLTLLACPVFFCIHRGCRRGLDLTFDYLVMQLSLPEKND